MKTNAKQFTLQQSKECNTCESFREMSKLMGNAVANPVDKRGKGAQCSFCESFPRPEHERLVVIQEPLDLAWNTVNSSFAYDKGRQVEHEEGNRHTQEIHALVQDIEEEPKGKHEGPEGHCHSNGQSNEEGPLLEGFVCINEGGHSPEDRVMGIHSVPDGGHKH